MLDLLLSRRADVAERTGTGSSALHAAVISGCRNTTAILLKHKASVEARDSKGNQALHLAASYGDSEMVQMLLRFGADSSASGDEGPAWRVAKRRGFPEVSELLRARRTSEL